MAPKALEAVVLGDNTATADGLKAGHGLALLLRTRSGQIMFDTGDGDETWENAAAMDVDLSRVCCVALSHGHYDHTNGLPTLLQRLGGVTVTAHPAVFEPRYADRAGGQRASIGMPSSREELEAMGAVFRLTATPVSIAPWLITTGEIPRVSDLAPVSPHLLVERDGQVIEDDFVDDLSLVARSDEGDVLLTGCAHAGLIDIVAQATDLTGRCPRSIAGGTHLSRERDERIAEVAETLYEQGVRQIVPMHCSGERGAEMLERHFPGETLRAGVGNTITADSTGRIAVH
jgi:7,8-dihydropterin-6-yl-methyl-4-(beta-D-ribofuranosyl)aminobenzene 5'-phosphate synthase